jgi:arylsulfatase A-like enzyme
MASVKPGAPSVIWVVTSQWRAQACGYAGDPNARTPQLDSLAAEGVNCPLAVSNHPFGPFARAALLTGRFSPGNRVATTFDPLPAETETAAHWFASAGYATGFFGKWHLYRRDPVASPVGEAHARVVVPPERRGGFGHWEGFESGFLLNDPLLHGDGIEGVQRFAGYQADVVIERAIAWLEQTPRPRFCVISLENPHPPYAAPAGGVPPLDPAAVTLRANVPLGGAIETKARQELAGYYAHIEATDRAIGRLIHFLDTGEPGQTVLAVTSSHGDMHGSAGLFRKGWPHAESIRVPLLWRWPGGLPSGAVNHCLIGLVDLAPTSLGLAGLSIPAGLDGRDLSAVLRGEADGPDEILLSMPEAPPYPLQCDQPWRGRMTRQRFAVERLDGTPWLAFDLAGESPA